MKNDFKRWGTAVAIKINPELVEALQPYHGKQVILTLRDGVLVVAHVAPPASQQPIDLPAEYEV